MTKTISSNNNVGIQDLRAFIHGLRMNGLADIPDNNAREKISMAISELPAPESLDSMIRNPVELKKIEDAVGKIMKLIEENSVTNPDIAASFEAKRGIPYRYNSIKRRLAVKKEDLTQKIIVASEQADKTGHIKLAKRGIDLAQKAIGDNLSEAKLIQFAKDCENSGMWKEAQAPNVFKNMWDKMTGGKGSSMQKQRQKSQTAILNSLNYLSKMIGQDNLDPNQVTKIIENMPESSVKQKMENMNQEMTQTFENLYQQIQNIAQEADQSLKQYQNADPFASQQSNQSQETAQQGEPEQQPEAYNDFGAEQTSQSPSSQVEFKPGMKVKYVNKAGQEKEAVVNEDQSQAPEGNVMLHPSSHPTAIFPMEKQNLRQACRRYQMKKRASLNKWVRIA